MSDWLKPIPVTHSPVQTQWSNQKFSTTSQSSVPHSTTATRAHVLGGGTRAHLRKRVARVVLFLREHRGDQSSHTIHKKTGIEMNKDSDVLKALESNPKVEVKKQQETITWRYKPKIDNITNKKELSIYIRDHCFGVKYNDIVDSYVECKYDLENLIEKEQIIKVTNKGKAHAHDILFWFVLFLTYSISWSFLTTNHPTNKLKI